MLFMKQPDIILVLWQWRLMVRTFHSLERSLHHPTIFIDERLKRKKEKLLAFWEVESWIFFLFRLFISIFFSKKKKKACMHTYIYIDEHILERALLCCRPYLANLLASMLCLLRNRQWDKNSHFNSYIMSSLVDLPKFVKGCG